MGQELQIEQLLQAKGFNEAAVFIQDEKICIVLEDNMLSTDAAAQVVDIVKSITGKGMESVVIVPKNAQITYFLSRKKRFYVKYLYNKKIYKIIEIDKILSPIHKNIQLNTQESNTILQIRNTLLPKLMSGEIKVN